MSGFLICEGKIIIVITQRGGRRHAKAWSKSIICSLYIRKYLSLFFSTRVFGWVVFHGWSSHVSNRSVRFCFLFPGSQRVFRALGAARPPYLSAEISMWMLQLFGCGIFPHTGSYQSRMIGHCLHSINHRPGPEKKTRRRQMSSLTPSCTLHPPLHPVSSSPRDEEHVVVIYIPMAW